MVGDGGSVIGDLVLCSGGGDPASDRVCEKDWLYWIAVMVVALVDVGKVLALACGRVVAVLGIVKLLALDSGRVVTLVEGW